MQRTTPLLAIVILGFLAFTANAGGDGKANSKEIADLISRLASKPYAEREAATRALNAIGAPALDALRKAATGGDLETRRRAESLILAIEHRLENERLLRPTMVRLDLKDITVPDAIAELAKRSGFPIRLESDSPALHERRVTLQTEEIPFWEALYRLCAKAELMERNVERTETPTGVRMEDARAAQAIVVRLRAVAAARPLPMGLLNITEPSNWDKGKEILLTSGSSQAEATSNAGAIRLRASRAQTNELRPGEYELRLEATVEPSMRWNETMSIRIDRAMDDQGQELRLVPGFSIRPKTAFEDFQGLIIVNSQIMSADGALRKGNPFIPVRLKAGSKPTQSIKELSGLIAALISSAPRDLVTIDGILETAGRKVHGSQGGMVRICEIKQQDSGEIALRLEVEAPPRELSDGTTLPPQLRVNIVVNGEMLSNQDEPLNSSHFRLLDANNKPLEIVQAVGTGKYSGRAREYELTFRPAAGQGAPARFIYRDRPSAIVEIPFTLRNVPLR